MSDSQPCQSVAVERFRTLHESGCFVLPNPWDIGTAVYLEHLGFRALATTSAGFAFSRGLPDSVAAIPRDTMLAHIREVVAVTSLPVNADFQNGYATDPVAVAENVELCVKTGVAGLSLEDATGDASNPLYERSLAIARISAAREAIDRFGVPVVLTARCEARLVEYPDADLVIRDRLPAYADAGADCLYAPGIRDITHVADLVRLVAPKPLNVLMSGAGTNLTVSTLKSAGVRRISLGSALARVAWGAFSRAARDIVEAGTFIRLAEAVSFDDLNDIFGAHR